jgi:transposase
VTNTPAPLPTDLAAAHAMILAERSARLAAEAKAEEVLAARLEIERLKLEIARLRREKYGPSSERAVHIEQLELSLEALEETAAEASAAAAVQEQETPVRAFTRRKPARRPLPEHLARKRIVYPVATACACCGGELRKLGEDITETLERVPASWFVIEHVREKMTCRRCETITQPPAPFHPIARGRAGPNLLAEVVFGKFGLHLPLHRQSERFSREGVPIDVSTLADWVGAVTVSLRPLTEAIEAHIRSAERLHADDTPVPVLARGKTRTGRLWTVVRDDRPFGGPDPPAAAYFYSPDRRGEHPESFLGGFAGILQADAYSGFGRLYEHGRQRGPMREAACWAHARRNFFKLAVEKAPLAIEAVQRIDAILAIEREINGLTAEVRLAARAERSRPFVDDLGIWLREQRGKLSSKTDPAKAMSYMLSRWASFTRFLEDGRVCMTNNAAERSIRPLAVGRRNWTFAGSDAGGRRAAAMYTLIETCKLNDVDARAWLADVLARLPEHPALRVDELLPWNWKPTIEQPQRTAA